MPLAPPNPQERPGFVSALDRFWLRVTEGLELSQLWKQFHTDARASFRLYRRDYDARAEAPDPRHKFWHTAQELAWAILEKLSPARRVLLLVGVLLLIFPAGSFSHHDKAGEITVVEFDFRFWGGASLFILLMLEISDRVVMKRDLEIARDIQKWLLPSTPPVIPGMALAFAARPANTVAGDFYDVFPRADSSGANSRYLLAIADVAGKSIPAALLMATFQASLKTLSSTACPLHELAIDMNRYACGNSQSGLRFTTAFLAEFDSASRRFTYINAGHNPPILRRNSGAIERLDRGGLPLGILAEGAYESGSVTLQAGDWLLLFTDGLIEAENERREEYGETRVLQVLEAGKTAAPEEMLRWLMSDLDGFVGATPQHDDVTCMVIKVI